MSFNRGVVLCAALAVTCVPPVIAQQPQFTTLKAESLPGERTIFFDDFSDMSAGDAPAHFKTRGAAPELRAAGPLRQLTYLASGALFPNLTALPKNFTWEAETMLAAPAGTLRIYLMLYSKDKEAAEWSFTVRASETGMNLLQRLPKYEALARATIKPDLTRPVKMALWIQDGRLRAFVNGDKQFDVNQVELPQIDKVEIRVDMAGTGQSVGFRSVRFAESAPDFSQVITASGRYVSHGILFDTDSDVLKAESASAIQFIAKGLEANPSLKFLIEGHTDNVGNAAHNLDLSKRRAEAVKTVLVNQFKVDPSRLTTTGLGATKPIESNDTPTGRAQNRRVEFVKQ